MVARSTAGCYTCKRRKKKCDEAQPYCSRCIRSGRECEGYAPLESPDSRGIMRSGKPKGNRIAKVPSQSHTTNTLTLEGASQSNSSASPGTSDQYSNTDLLAPPVGRLSQPSDMDDVGFFPPLETIWYPDTIIRGPTLVGELPAGSPFQGSHASSLFFEGRNLLGYHQTTPSGLPSYESTSPQIKDGDLEDDPEGTRQEMCIVPVPDPNTPDNALPFVLQSYARWITLVAFESSKAIYSLKELIVNKFMHSPGERSKIILLSNVIGSLGKTIELGSMGTSLITYLRTEAHDNISKFIAEPPAGQREVDMKNASEALDLMMEVILTQRYSSSTLSLMRLMEAAAPVFRRACPEPMDQYVNLPRAILSPTINVRHFALTDILISTATGRPMLFRYDVEYPSDILEKMKEGIHGMEWLHGIPDQYIVLLARINVLSEEYGANVSSQCVAKIENWIHEVEIVTKHSADPVATIRRFTVRECWKLTMQIYLYMFLGRASAADPRVLKMVKSFIRLMEAVSPGRNPDSFLYVPMIIVGASAYRYQDRAVIRQRMLGLQECVKQGSCGHDALHMLIDLWTRTEAEDRPAVWDDLRFSALRVLGV